MPGGGGTTTNTTIQSNELPDVVDQFLEQITPAGVEAYTSAVGTLGGGAGQFLPSAPRSVLPFTANELAGFAGIEDIAGAGPTPLLTSATGQAEDIIGRGGIDPLSEEAAGIYRGYATGEAIDPTLRSYAEGAQFDNNPFRDQMLGVLQEDIRNQVAQQFGGAGNAWEPQHAAAVSKALTDASAPILYQSYESDVGRQLEAIDRINEQLMLGAGGLAGVGGRGVENLYAGIGLQPQLDAAAYEPSKALALLGQTERGLEQERSDAAYAYEALSGEQEMELLRQLASLGLGVSPTLGTRGTTTTTEQVPDDQLATILGLGLGTAALFL